MGKQHSSAIEIIHRIDCGPDRGMAHGAKSEYRLEPDIEVAENFGLTRKQLAWFKDAKVAYVLQGRAALSRTFLLAGFRCRSGTRIDRASGKVSADLLARFLTRV